MGEEDPLRILTDDFSCRVLSDMIWKEERSCSTGLFYGVKCTSPIIVPIENTPHGRDYQTWVAFDSASDLMQKSIAVKQGEGTKRVILVYAKQSLLPEWYTNNLLSRGGNTVRGNVLLVVPDQNWPEQLVVPPESVAKWMRSVGEREEERCQTEEQFRGENRISTADLCHH